jgi:hypothetical protein
MFSDVLGVYSGPETESAGQSNQKSPTFVPHDQVSREDIQRASKKIRKRANSYSRSEKASFTGMDTETFEGILKLLCSPTEHYEPTDSALDLLEWMYSRGAEVVWTYNLKFDEGVLLRAIYERLSPDDQKRIEKEVRRPEDHRFSVGPFDVKLIGAKSLEVSKFSDAEHAVPSGPPVAFFDVSQFYTVGERRVTLDEAAKSVLREGKNAEELGIDRRSIGKEAGYYEAHRELIIKYCKKDAELTARLGERIMDIAFQVLGAYPARWSSGASLSKCWLQVNHPELKLLPREDWAEFGFSFRGGLFVTRHLGRVRNVTEADLTNAYGDALCRLKSVEGLSVVKGFARSPDAVYGTYFIEVPYDGKLPWRLGDLEIRTDKSKTGKFERVLYPDSFHESRPYYATLPELEWFDESGRPYTVLQSTELVPPSGVRVEDIPPLFPELPVLLKQVAELKNAIKKAPLGSDERIELTMRREMLKRVVNALYGCLSESRHGETKWTTWPLSAAITAACRVKIWRTWDRIEETGGTVLSINTDSLRYVPGEWRVPEHKGVVGDFEDKFTGATVTHYQSGVALIEHRPDCGCGECADLPRILRADDGLGSRAPYPNETENRLRERLAHPPAPHEEDGLEVHASVCPCKRCARAPRGQLRKRGMPKLTATDLLVAPGFEIEVVQVRPLGFVEGLMLSDPNDEDANRMKDVGDIPDGEEEIDAKDGTRRRHLSLLSNLVTAHYDPKALTYPNLNHGLVRGTPMPYEQVWTRSWVKAAMRKRVEVEELEAV